MKKIFGIKLGGLHQKLLSLVLVFLVALIGVFTVVTFYQSNQLNKVVSNARNEQQDAIRTVSGNTIHQVIESSMTKTNGLQAYIADDMFSDIKTDVATLQSLATGLFEHKDSFEPYPAYLPDKANNGKFSAQVLYEEGVDYKKSALLGVAAHMSETMIAMCEKSEYLTNCFIGLADGTALCVDRESASKFDEKGDIPAFPVRERPWYTMAEESGEISFTGIEDDTYTDNIGVECSAPVYLDGELIGVVGADLFLGAMSDYVSRSSDQGSNICVVSNNGQVIFAPVDNGVFTVDTSDKADDLRESKNKELADFITNALTAQTGLISLNVNGKEYYMAGTPMNTVGWAVISFIDKDLTELPAKMMISEYDRINEEAAVKYDDATKNSRRTTYVMIGAILLFGIIGAIIMANKIVKPIERMTERIGEINGTDLAFEMEKIYETGDEIEVLAESFTTLSRRTREYITQITKITAEKERIGAELELATKIQADMLPNIFPAFPEREEFDIYATMTPAKEVGGDFYDFFLVDDDHLAMVMADVSGKGVPAALFMMMSKILVNNYTMMETSPAKVLEQVNTQICKNNEEEMFVTVWLGIMDLRTGTITAANAGHEYPILRKANGEFELFKDKHGFVIGGMDGMKYKEYEFTIEKGGMLFLYTDGVAEATNAENVLFGTDRMIETLNREKTTDPKTLLNNMKRSVDEFVGEAPQFDDLTMLGMTYYGKEGE